MSKKKQKKALLEGHKRVGKRFIPPMMQIPAMKSISYVSDMLPELLWIGLLNDRVGYVRAARILEKVFVATDEVKDPEQHGNFALASTFSLLESDQKQTLAAALEKEGVVDPIRNAVAPLTLLYDPFPLRFLGPPTDVINEKQLIERVRECVAKSIDKYETAGIVLHGAMLLSRLVTRKIRFPSDMDLPDFNAVITSPGSDDANRAAGWMRANALAEFGMLNIDKSWAQYFWNRGVELSPCETGLTEEEDDDE
jgi:hypothetical protein